MHWLMSVGLQAERLCKLYKDKVIRTQIHVIPSIVKTDMTFARIPETVAVKLRYLINLWTLSLPGSCRIPDIVQMFFCSSNRHKENVLTNLRKHEFCSGFFWFWVQIFKNIYLHNLFLAVELRPQQKEMLTSQIVPTFVLLGLWFTDSIWSIPESK